MRIGIDARLWSQTGVGRYTRELVKNLEEINKENQYFLFLRNEEFKSLKFKGLNFEKRLAEVRWHSLKEQIIMPWILRREHLDLMHFPYFSVPVFYPGKFIVTIHDLILDHFETGKASTLPWIIYRIKRLGYKVVMWITLHRATGIITVSEATKKEIIQHYRIKPKKIIVTYEAGSEEGADTVPPLRCEPKPYFLYVGNAYPHKNLEKLVEAFRECNNATMQQCNNAGGKLKLILVGPDDYFYKKLKEKIGQIGLMRQISFYGPATKEELTGLYKNALALIFPSLMEGFGLPGIEAMASGCPVICSDIPVFHEIYGEAAIYFNPNEVANISEKLQMVIENPQEFQSLKSKGLKRVQQYSWQKLARETLAVYKNI